MGGGFLDWWDAIFYSLVGRGDGVSRFPGGGDWYG
jgi:hypothetical protein